MGKKGKRGQTPHSCRVAPAQGGEEKPGHARGQTQGARLVEGAGTVGGRPGVVGPVFRFHRGRRNHLLPLGFWAYCRCLLGREMNRDRFLPALHLRFPPAFLAHFLRCFDGWNSRRNALSSPASKRAAIRHFANSRPKLAPSASLPPANAAGWRISGGAAHATRPRRRRAAAETGDEATKRRAEHEDPATHIRTGRDGQLGQGGGETRPEDAASPKGGAYSTQSEVKRP